MMRRASRRSIAGGIRQLAWWNTVATITRISNSTTEVSGMAKAMIASGPRHRRQGDLAEMEAQRGGGVEVPVAVMHLVEAPQERPFVVGAVPPVDPEIEQQDVERQPAPTVRPAHQFRPAPRRMQRRPDRDRQDEQGRQRAVEDEEAEIAPPAREPGRAIAGQMDGRRGGRPPLLDRQRQHDPPGHDRPLGRQQVLHTEDLPWDWNIARNRGSVQDAAALPDT